MTGAVHRFTGAPLNGKPTEECRCISQRLSGQDDLGRQEAIRQLLFILTIYHGDSNRVFRQEMAFEMPEPYALKGACTVLRGLGDGNIPRLPDFLI